MSLYKQSGDEVLKHTTESDSKPEKLCMYISKFILYFTLNTKTSV